MNKGRLKAGNTACPLPAFATRTYAVSPFADHSKNMLRAHAAIFYLNLYKFFSNATFNAAIHATHSKTTVESKARSWQFLPMVEQIFNSTAMDDDVYE